MTKAPTFSFVNSNYFQFNGDVENMGLVTASKKIGSKLNLSLGLGVDVNSTIGSEKSSTFRPELEAKAKYNISDNLNAQLRYRRRSHKDQYRATFGGSRKIDKNQSIYSAVHVTVNKDENFSANAGAWVGYTYEFNNGISVSAEVQANTPLGKNKPLSETLPDKGNYMVNVIASIPIK